MKRAAHNKRICNLTVPQMIQQSKDTCSPLSLMKDGKSPSPYMTWSGICATGKSLLTFVDEGFKTNHQTYGKTLGEYFASLIPIVLRKWKNELSNNILTKHTEQDGHRNGKSNIWKSLWELRSIPFTLYISPT